MEEPILRALRAVRVTAGASRDGLDALALPVAQDPEEVRRERFSLLAPREMAADRLEVGAETADRGAAAQYCTTFSGTDGFATRTMFYSTSAACSGASSVVSGAGTYRLVGAATTPADATKMNLVLSGFGMRFSILARDGANLKLGKEDETHDGFTEEQRYARFMAESQTKRTCPF